MPANTTSVDSFLARLQQVGPQICLIHGDLVLAEPAALRAAEALAAGHPGLTAMGITAPDADGLWRFADYGYGRELARLHPNTTL